MVTDRVAARRSLRRPAEEPSITRGALLDRTPSSVRKRADRPTNQPRFGFDGSPEFFYRQVRCRAIPASSVW